MSSYDVIVTFNARKHSVRYWPDGNGRFYQGYATSLAQLKRNIAKHFATHDLHLYIVSSTKQRMLTTDTQLRNHLDRLPNGTTTLYISALQRRTPDSSPKHHKLSRPSKHTLRQAPTLAPSTSPKHAPINRSTSKTSRTSKTSNPTSTSAHSTPKFSPNARITWVPLVL